ncbi:DEAD/DEAH box helicase [Ruminococcus sp. OM05-10BH]|nr:DEAD/DEAH box helicase [Ruminococcus sp. OM05-10BH]
MPTKAEQYAQMADQVARQLTGSWQEWAGFLTTAARLYKYPFHEQLMIYAQRPDATACAEYDLWNNRMGRYVRRGSKGIALVDDSGDRPRLRYVFDISDTGTREHSRTPWLWTMNEEHTAPVMAMLERNYDVSGSDLPQQLADVAAGLAEEYWTDHRQDILYIVDGSFLEEYDEYNIEVQFKSAAAVSITYALMSRCGLEPEQYFSHEDFMAIFDFNTPATVGALGTAVSQINQQVLRQIGVTIQNYERAKSAERSATHGEQPDLQEERRLPDPRPEAVQTAGEAPGQVRQDEESVPERTPAHPLQPAADERETVPAPFGDRRDREQPPRTDDAPAGRVGGRDGGAESRRPDGLGGPDEHLQGPGGGDSAGGTYQQLTLNLFLSEAEQIQRIDEAESVKTPSAFSMPKPAAQAEPVRRPLTQAEIDAAIQEWNGKIESKHAVVRYMKDHAREKDTAAWLRQEYGDDLPALPVTVDGAAGDVPWPKVQRRIAQLIKEDRFYTEAEQDRFDNIDPIAIREALAERGIVNGQVVDPEKLDSDPFIQQVMRDVEAVAAEEQAETAAKPPVPDLSGQPVTREGDTLTIGSGEPTHEIDITVSDEEYAAIRGTIPERISYDPSAPVYNVGDTVYLDDRAHQITELREDTVQLLPTGMSYPIYRAESRERFEQLLRADNRNDFYTEFLPVNPDTADQDLRDVLTHGLIGAPDKAELSELLRTGKSNREVALWLSRAYPDIIETMELETGDTADYRTIPEGIELEVLDADEKRLAMLFFRWDEVSPLLRGLYARQLDGFVQEQDEPYMEVPAAVEEPAETDKPIEEAAEAPAFHSETVAVYPGDKNHLPYDVVVERLHVDRPEHTPPEPTPDTQPEEKPDHPVSIPVNGEWQTFPNQRAAEQAAYQEYRDNLRRNAKNFRITDDHLGEGGPKAKYQANVAAIKLLKYLEETTGQATPEQQEVLSRYVGWGGVADAFDPDKPAWAAEYAELKELLTPEEYEAARASTLNAHYTSPTVIRAVYETVERMGFRTGNILEPSMGVGNFFGLLPESMAGSRLYGVELDSISGRIARQLYPKADITVAGFETTDRRDFYDLAIGNVPFGQYQVNDKAYNKLGFNIHNYFFAKALDQVRPGGVVAFVTSRYTMDAKDSTVRRYLAQRAELLGAIRLPNNAFRANAGTDVVSDILFLQKRDRPLDIAPDWTQTGRTEEGFTVNQYFLDHPEMVLGRPTAESTQYGKQDYTVAPIEGLELADQLHDAVQYIHGTYQEAALPELGEGEDIDESLPADPNVKNYSYTVVDGAVYFRENSRMVRPDLNATAEARVKGLVGLRDCVQRLIDLEMDAAAPDADIQAQMAELNRRYDDFSVKYGLINDRANRLAFADDSSYYLLCALEVLDEDGRLERKADMFTKRTIKPHEAVTTVDTASEALAVSISEKACVDMAYMEQLTGKTGEELAAELRGVIFRLPGPVPEGERPQYVTADEYLSGNVRRKLRQAQRAAEQDLAFAVNVEALTAAQPKDLDASEIEVRLGATWIDKEYIQRFMYETFDTPFYLQRSIEVHYTPFTAEWQISGKNVVGQNNVAAYSTYGTGRANAYKILEDSLNLRDVRIYDTVEDADGKERRVLNAKETTLAAQKQQAIRDAFRDWIWRDPERRQALVRQYNEEMNATRPREYDGSHIVFGGINPAITLREHQKNAIAHVLYGGNTLLAHEVGAGKTYEMVGAAMEAKRLGLCQKSLFVVPNHLTEQWASEFLRLYPSANILVTTKKDFEKHNRKKFCARIATGDYDAIIMGHSQFEKIPISKERQERLLHEQIWEITEGIAEVEASGGERFTVKQLERTKKSLEARLEKLQAEGRKDDVVTFEQLGVDRLFVDEAHNYKNLFLYTKMRNVAGLSTTDAQKSSDMFAKCRYMDEITGGRGVVFATGTPVSNSMTELYTMQRYLQYDRLQELGMAHFDCWASRFGETVTALELAPEGYTLVGR